jgi:hypothetical protein
MIKYFLLCVPILFFNCSYLQTEETDAQTFEEPGNPIDTSIHLLSTDKLNAFKIAKLKEYSKNWDATYFPLPTPAMLQQQPAKDPGYIYISESFDSLSYKNSTEKERSAGSPCSWKQKFQSGIIYSKSTCTESGILYSITTKSNDKKTIVRLIDMLFYNSVNDWNADSTQYAPLSEKAGCYYAIEKNDFGYYDIKYSCSY